MTNTPANDGRRTTLGWAASAVSCAYIGWTGMSLHRATPYMVNLYASLGAELPLPTRVLLGSYPWVHLIVFGGIAILVIGTQFLKLESRLNLLAITGLTLLGAVAGNAMLWALYQPLVEVAQKVSG